MRWLLSEDDGRLMVMIISGDYDGHGEHGHDDDNGGDNDDCICDGWFDDDGT